MGVNGLWKLISPSGRMIDIATLRGKMLAVDASIWLTQFLKAMRDDEGRMIQNGHIVGTLRRVCKLLYHRIRTVFVFDGGVPFLKKRIMEKRRQRQAFDESRRQKAARGLLANQLLLQNEAKRAKFIQKDDDNNEEKEDEEGLDEAEKEERARKKRFVQPDDSDSEDDDKEPIVKERPITVSSSKSTAAGSKKETLEQQLAELGNGDEDDSEFNESEEEEYDERYGASVHNIDLSTIKDLPREQQYNILVRLREGNRESRRDELFPVAGDPSLYSATQLKHFLKDARRKKEIVDMQKSLSKRNHQKGSRIASDWTREYTLVLDQQLNGDKPSTNSTNQENSNARPVAKPDEETLQRKQQLGLFQSECVDRLYEGLDGTVDRDTCLAMLQANDFNVAELVENYRHERKEEDQKLRAIEQLFEGLGGTVDRETCRALLASNGWRVEETLLSYVDSHEPNLAKRKKKEEIIVVEEEEDEDDLTKPQNGGFLIVEEDEDDKFESDPQQIEANSNADKLIKSIVDANVRVVGEDKLIFRFNVNDITKESLALFADVLETREPENGEEGEKIHESDIEWEEESVSQQKRTMQAIEQKAEANPTPRTNQQSQENVEQPVVIKTDSDHKDD